MDRFAACIHKLSKAALNLGLAYYEQQAQSDYCSNEMPSCSPHESGGGGGGKSELTSTDRNQDLQSIERGGAIF